MKHIRRHIEKNKAPAVRKIISETNSGTGSKESHRVRLNLTIEVKKVIYSGADIPTTDQEGSTSSVGIIPTNNSSSSGEATLHLSGPVSQQNEHVKLGAFHTLDLEPGRQFTIIKGPMGWNYVNIQRIKEATESGRGAELAAILCDDTGKATICLISPHTTLIKKRIEVTIPKKKRPGQGSDKAMEKFYKQIFESVLQYFNLTELKLVIIASPGATKDLVYESIFSEATKEILTSKSKFQRVYSPSVHIQSLTEVLSSPQVSNQLKDSQYSKEIQALDKFQKMLNSDEHRAWYGEKHVDQAAERGAIELNEMSGVAAILTYPLDIDVIEAEERLPALLIMPIKPFLLAEFDAVDAKASDKLNIFNGAYEMTSNDDKDRMIANLQWQLAAATIGDDSFQTPFYKWFMKDPQGVAKDTDKLQRDGSNFVDGKELLQLLETECYGTLRSKYLELTRQMLDMSQLTDPEQSITKWNNICSATMESKLSTDQMLGVLIQAKIPPPSQYQADLFHQNIQAILDREDHIAGYRHTTQVIREKLGKLKQMGKSVDDLIYVAKATKGHPHKRTVVSSQPTSSCHRPT
ncbi:hypothetical protein BY996DRAFT_6530487 [Phakopsora pachyrhizi]|nr:hypothetical protein BY996DRAFT_6530487 [Phakopsora pachyrhizi]